MAWQPWTPQWPSDGWSKIGNRRYAAPRRSRRHGKATIPKLTTIRWNRVASWSRCPTGTSARTNSSRASENRRTQGRKGTRVPIPGGRRMEQSRQALKWLLDIRHSSSDCLSSIEIIFHWIFAVLQPLGLNLFKDMGNKTNFSYFNNCDELLHLRFRTVSHPNNKSCWSWM